MSMRQISPAMIADCIIHVGKDLGLTTMFWGQPGVAKSHGVRQAAKRLGAMLVDVRLAQYDSVDLRGIPVPDKDRNQTTWYAPITLPFVGNDAFPDDVPIILFLDEATSATNPVFAVFYQLADEHRVGEHVLKPNVIVVCAGNREGDRGVVNRMPLPLCNRMIHYEVILPVEEWIVNWAATCGYAEAPVVIALMQFKQDLFNTFNPAQPDKAFATARSWEYFLKIVSSPTMPDDVKDASAAGAVGAGPADEFFAFKKIWQTMVPIEDIEADPEGTPVPSLEEASLAWALAVNISGHLRPAEMLGRKVVTPGNTAPLTRYLERLGDEYMVLAWNLAIARDGELLGTPEFLKLASAQKLVYQA